MNQYLVGIPGYKEAIGKLPQEEITMDESFFETYSEGINELKEVFASKGGIHVISREDSEKPYAIIVRVPSKVQASMIFENLLYPSPETVAKWFEEAPGLPVTYGNELTDLAGTTATAVRKKL